MPGRPRGDQGSCRGRAGASWARAPPVELASAGEGALAKDGGSGRGGRGTGPASLARARVGWSRPSVRGREAGAGIRVAGFVFAEPWTWTVIIAAAIIRLNLTLGM